MQGINPSNLDFSYDTQNTQKLGRYILRATASQITSESACNGDQSIRQCQKECNAPPYPVILRLVTRDHQFHNKVGAVPRGGQHSPALRGAIERALICWELVLLADLAGLQQHQRCWGVQHLHRRTYSTSNPGSQSMAWRHTQVINLSSTRVVKPYSRS